MGKKVDEPKEPAYLTLFLVSPVLYQDTDDADHTAGVEEDPETCRRVADFYTRVRRALVKLGAPTGDSTRRSVTIEGFNWRGKASGETFFLNAEVVTKLEGVVAERERLRAEALSLLSDEQKDALGLFDTKVVHHWH